MVFVFKENCIDGREEQITWWHEQTHCAYNNLTLGDKVKLSKEALNWLKKNAPSKYDVIRGHYQEEKWENEGVAVFIEELIKRNGISDFMTSDFADLGGLAKLADVIRYSINMEQKKQEEKSRKVIDLDNPLPDPTPELTALGKTRQTSDEELTEEERASLKALYEKLRKEAGY